MFVIVLVPGIRDPNIQKKLSKENVVATKITLILISAKLVAVVELI